VERFPVFCYAKAVFVLQKQTQAQSARENALKLYFENKFEQGIINAPMFDFQFSVEFTMGARDTSQIFPPSTKVSVCLNIIIIASPLPNER